MPKQLLYQDSDYKVEFETLGTTVCLHVEVTRWSHSVLRKGYRLFVEFQAMFKERGYTEMCTFTPNPKFVKLFGGTTIANFKYENIDYEAITWELN